MTLHRLCLAASTLVFAGQAGAVAIYQTDDPFGGPFGLIGFDVSSQQSVALRFVPGANYKLDQVGLWFMSNDFAGRTHPLVTITLRADDASGGGSIPGSTIIESWQFEVSAVGWDPQLELLESKVRPFLSFGTRYWIVAESDAPGGLDGVWNWAGAGLGFMSICNGDPCEWFSGPGAVAATIVEGTEIAPADLDHDGHVSGTDLAMLLAPWGSCSAPPAPCPADVNHDGIVGGLDLAMLLASWG